MLVEVFNVVVPFEVSVLGEVLIVDVTREEVLELFSSESNSSFFDEEVVETLEVVESGN